MGVCGSGFVIASHAVVFPATRIPACGSAPVVVQWVPPDGRLQVLRGPLSLPVSGAVGRFVGRIGAAAAIACWEFGPFWMWREGPFQAGAASCASHLEVCAALWHGELSFPCCCSGVGRVSQDPWLLFIGSSLWKPRPGLWVPQAFQWVKVGPRLSVRSSGCS